MRTSNAGGYSGEGRQADPLAAHPAAKKLLTDGAHRIYSFGPAQDWDGQWVLVQVRVPESDRRARHVVRTRLAWAGFGSLGPGLWLSPHVSREQEAIRVLTDAGAAGDAHVFVARRTGSPTEGDGRGAWTCRRSRRSTSTSSRVPDSRHPGRRAPCASFEMVHAWRRFPALDPSLPRELLPARWSGIRAGGAVRRPARAVA